MNPHVNTDKLLYRDEETFTEVYLVEAGPESQAGLAISCGGRVFEMPIGAWHAMAKEKSKEWDEVADSLRITP